MKLLVLVCIGITFLVISTIRIDVEKLNHDFNKIFDHKVIGSYEKYFKGHHVNDKHK